VHDLSGKAVGIGARILPGGSGRDEGPKYLNSPETPVYRKAEVLYNLQRAKASATKLGELYLVEGYTDVIAMVRAGVTNTVATCGTALGEGHFRLASRFARGWCSRSTRTTPGARAAERAFEFVERFPVQPVVLILPEGLDPGGLRRQHGGEALRELAADGRPARRVHGAPDRGPSRPLDDRGPERGGRRGRAAARTARRPGPAERVRAPARGARRRVGGLGRPRARAAALGTPVEVQQAVKRASAQEKVEREMLRILARDAEAFGGSRRA
jgi:DNA primase